MSKSDPARPPKRARWFRFDTGTSIAYVPAPFEVDAIARLRRNSYKGAPVHDWPVSLAFESATQDDIAKHIASRDNEEKSHEGHNDREQRDIEQHR